MRENAEHALMLLLRAGLWERPIETVAPFPLTETEWEEVLEMARRQTVAGIVAKGLEYLPETQKPKNSDKKHHPEKDPRLFPQKCKDNSFFLILFSSLFLHRSSPFFYFLLSESSFQKSNAVKIS